LVIHYPQAGVSCQKLSNFPMPRKRRAATASAENGTKSGEGRLGLGAAKRLKTDGHEMGTVENKEVSRFQGFHIPRASKMQKIYVLSAKTLSVRQMHKPVAAVDFSIINQTLLMSRPSLSLPVELEVAIYFSCQSFIVS
jgi:hypothetical protein